MDEQASASENAVTRLTDRQRACLRLVAKGYTSKEIGRQLEISPATVDSHVRAILDTLQVETRAEAARRLAAVEAPGQPLTSQSAELAGRSDVEPMLSPADRDGWAFWLRMIPPLGGVPHDLSWDRRLLAILRVAVAGFVAMLVLTLAIIVLLWLLR